MSQNQCDYEVGRGKPPVHSRFKKGEPGNPRGTAPEKFAGIASCGAQPVVVTIDGERREITKRELG